MEKSVFFCEISREGICQVKLRLIIIVISHRGYVGSGGRNPETHGSEFSAPLEAFLLDPLCLETIAVWKVGI